MSDEKAPDTLKFKYVIPNDLRDLYVNGVWGGVSPRNEICMQFFSERNPIPKEIKHKLADDNMYGPGEPSFGADVVRIVQASVTVDLGTAVAIRDWLSERIKRVEQRSSETPKEDGGT